jgi:hypothetical protein
MSWLALSAAIAMVACMSGWKAAAHRMDDKMATALAGLFFLFTFVLLALIVGSFFARAS